MSVWNPDHVHRDRHRHRHEWPAEWSRPRLLWCAQVQSEWRRKKGMKRRDWMCQLQQMQQMMVDAVGLVP